MVKNLRRWGERQTTLVAGDREYQGFVGFFDIELDLDDGRCKQVHEYHYFFQTLDGERIPIYSQGKNRVRASEGKLIQKL